MRDIFNSGLWTRARFNSFITSALRSASRKWPPKYSTLAAAKRGKQVNKSSGRLAEHYKCASCLGDFPAKQVQVDHIKPMGVGRSWDDFINELYCEADNLQVLCKECHAKKTKLERKKK